MMEDIVAADIETTGLSTSRDRIVEIALVRLKPDGSRQKWCRLVNPTISIPPFVQTIHGITDEMVRDCKTFREIVPEFLDFIGTTSTLCGHNLIRFDLPMIQSELVRAGFKPLDVSKRSVVDSLVIFRKMEPHTLSKAVEFYCPERPLTNAHRAAADAEAALDVYLGQKQLYAPTLGHDDKYIASLCGNTTANFFQPPPKSHTTKNSSKSPQDTNNQKSVAQDSKHQNNNTSALASSGATTAAITMGHEAGKLEGGILMFGKHRGESLIDVATSDAPYLRWLLRTTPTANATLRSAILSALSQPPSL